VAAGGADTHGVHGRRAELGGDLPLLTQVVVHASYVVRGYWFILFPAMGGSIYGFRRWKRTPAGRLVWDRFKLRVPAGIGKVVLKVTMARFSRTLATLVAAGVDIIKALEISGQTAGNWVVESALADVRAQVHQGVPIAQPLIENPVFPPLVSQMVKVGEETGERRRCWTRSRTSTRTRSTSRSPPSPPSSSRS